jgi:hypothetical protein
VRVQIVFATTAVALCISGPDVAGQESPCRSGETTPAANQMSEADRSIFLYNLPSRLLTEGESTERRLGSLQGQLRAWL